MAQQDPCWIDVQSLLESSVLHFLLRASSANIVSVSAAELKMDSWCRRSHFFLIYSFMYYQENSNLVFTAPPCTLQHCTEHELSNIHDTAL